MLKKIKKNSHLCTTHALFLLEKKGSWPNYTLEMSYSWFVYVFTSTGALGKLGSSATKGTIFNFHFTSPCTYGPYMLKKERIFTRFPSVYSLFGPKDKTNTIFLLEKKGFWLVCLRFLRRQEP